MEPLVGFLASLPLYFHNDLAKEKETMVSQRSYPRERKVKYQGPIQLAYNNSHFFNSFMVGRLYIVLITNED